MVLLSVFAIRHLQKLAFLVHESSTVPVCHWLPTAAAADSDLPVSLSSVELCCRVGIRYRLA